MHLSQIHVYDNNVPRVKHLLKMSFSQICLINGSVSTTVRDSSKYIRYKIKHSLVEGQQSQASSPRQTIAATLVRHTRVDDSQWDQLVLLVWCMCT